MDTLNAPLVQSTAFVIQVDGGWEAQDDMEAADREGLQCVEALSYRCL